LLPTLERRFQVNKVIAASGYEPIAAPRFNLRRRAVSTPAGSDARLLMSEFKILQLIEAGLTA
jgi:hypothetical protein